MKDEMEDKFLLHEYLQLFSTPDKFYIKPSQLCCTSSEVLVIDRVSGESIVQDLDLVKLLGEETDFKLIFGFLGSIKLISGLYLVVVTDRILLGKLNGHAIFQVACTEIVPYAQSTSHLSSQQIEDNASCENMVRSMLELPGAYFSCSYDLTHTLQKLHSVTPDFHKKSLFSRADNRFVWNRHLLKDFSNEQYGRFTIPLIQGFVSINHVTVNGHKLIWSLVSRRSVDRTGTKLFVRGIDAQGNVANHVVTEQIIEHGRRITSFVLTRGSIPLPWTEYPDLGFMPKLNLARGDHVAMFVKHMSDQKQKYGNIVCVNLINHHGREAVLEEGYRAVVTAADLPGVKYCPFDFHAECSSLRYDKLDILIDSIAQELKEFRYFYIDDGTVVHRQTGTFRVNCMDCLDRTNVVQCILGKLQLKEALKQLAININSCDDENFTELDRLVNNVWGDHADMISIQYSGTCALKNDFTRTGKRTYTGVIGDVVNALIRYCMNNFNDGFKQDAFDVFLGNYVITDSNINTQLTPLSGSNNWKRITIPSVLLVAIFMFCGSIVLSENYGTEMLFSLMFWGTTALTTLRYIRRNPKEFVDWPKLSDVGRTPRGKAKSL